MPSFNIYVFMADERDWWLKIRGGPSAKKKQQPESEDGKVVITADNPVSCLYEYAKKVLERFLTDILEIKLWGEIEVIGKNWNIQIKLKRGGHQKSLTKFRSSQKI